MKSFLPKAPEQGLSWNQALVHSNYTSTGTTMPHQELLTEAQRLILQAPASDERGMVRHYTLTFEDLVLISRRRRDPNRLGFTIMLCYLRFPGRILQQGEQPPAALCAFVTEQLGLDAAQFGNYAERDQTCREHALEIQTAALGLRSFINGRGDLGRTPFFSRLDSNLIHEFTPLANHESSLLASHQRPGADEGPGHP
jgi:TnpA family transposase